MLFWSSAVAASWSLRAPIPPAYRGGGGAAPPLDAAMVPVAPAPPATGSSRNKPAGVGQPRQKGGAFKSLSTSKPLPQEARLGRTAAETKGESAADLLICMSKGSMIYAQNYSSLGEDEGPASTSGAADSHVRKAVPSSRSRRASLCRRKPGWAGRLLRLEGTAFLTWLSAAALTPRRHLRRRRRRRGSPSARPLPQEARLGRTAAETKGETPDVEAGPSSSPSEL
jgi:hypothetical protein